MARESSRIAPPSGLRVNRQSAVPVHVQLQAQIRHLISTGSFKPGMQLPTVRQLAGFLRINRNTVARALADLYQDGYLESQQGRGTYVAARPPAREGRAPGSLERLAQDALERARRLGFTQEELVATLAAQAPPLRAGKSARTPGIRWSATGKSSPATVSRSRRSCRSSSNACWSRSSKPGPRASRASSSASSSS